MRRFVLSTLLALFLLMPVGSHAEEEGSILFVAPYRIVMEGKKRVDVINVANKSSQVHRYDLMLVDQVMDKNGVTRKQETFEYSAKKMLRFVPKRFTLKPGESQVVRVMVSRPAGLADGDYHSHLLFREVPLNAEDREEKEKEDREKEQRTGSGDEKKKTLSFEIRTLYGIAVPVVVQHGNVQTDISFGDVKLNPAQGEKPASLTIGFNRIGNAEASGKLSIAYIPDDPAGAAKEAVQTIDPQWVRIYREVDTITKTIPLAHMPKNTGRGKLILTLLKDERDPSSIVSKTISYTP